MNEFIEQFIHEFEEFLPPDIYIKLKVIYWHFKGCHPREIKKKLNKLAYNDSFIKKHKITNANSIIAPYIRNDNKKISRLTSACTKTQHLPI